MELPKRKNQRLKNFDYNSCGAYYVTLCVNGSKPILSQVVNLSRRDNPCGCPQVILTPLGKICDETIYEVCKKYNIVIDNYIIMPDHIHMIIYIDDKNFRTTARVVPTVSDIIGAYKSLISTAWLKVCKQNNCVMGALWERSFYDHIIRDDEDYYVKARYIEENPMRWCMKHDFN